MNLKKNMKAFFTLKRHANDGFTLVELIVVIAILAILGGVAVPAYSGYVTRANKGADVTLIGEVQHALALYYYSNPDADLTTAWVKLDQEGTAATAGATGDAAMKAVFGEGWKDAVGLKHADWKGDSSATSYAQSSYYGKESELISTVDNLTGALGMVIEADKGMSGLIGGNFKTFLEDYKVDTTKGKEVGNAAVLYVAQNVQNNKAAIANAVNIGITKDYSTAGDIVDNIYNALPISAIGDAAALATVYAIAEGYAQHTGQADKFKPDFSAVTGATATQEAFEELSNSFKNLDITGIEDYINNGQGGKDLQGYLDMMGTIHNNENIVSGNLSADDCFTDGTVETLLKGHAAMSSMSITTADGQVAVGLAVDADGVVITPVTPMNWNK